MLEFKSYVQIICEDKSRFVKKNPNLTSRHKRIVIQWLKDHQHAEREFLRKNGNDPMIFARMSMDDWNDFMEQAEDTKSQKKKKAKALRHKGISGLKQNTDYVHMKIKNKHFLVYIPLHAEAAKVIMSTHIGDCSHQGCIGSSSAEYHYKSEASRTGKIPIVVIGNEQKYVVMMDRSNKRWEIWYHTNLPADVRRDEGIENFSIRKELVGNKQSELYDEIREDVWMKNEGKDDAIEAYEQLVQDIESYVSDYNDAMEEGQREVEKIMDDTIDQYREWGKDIVRDFERNVEELKYGMEGAEIMKRKNMKKRIEALKYVLKHNPQGTDVDRKGNPVWYIGGVEKHADSDSRRINPTLGVTGATETGVPYTKKELQRYIKFAEKNWLKDLDASDYIENEHIQAKREDVYAQQDEFFGIANKIQNFKDSDESWKIYSEHRYGEKEYEWMDDVKWTDWLPDHENDWAENAHPPWMESDLYKPYSDFNEAYGGDRLEDEYLDDSISELVYQGGGGSIDGQEFLESQGFKHPNDIAG